MSTSEREVPRSKLALAAALRQTLATTPLAKVTVSGLAATAGVNRQTFYAHFANVYELAFWVFTTDVADHIMANAGYDGWADGFLELLEYLQGHRDQTYFVIRSLKHSELERFFYLELRAMMRIIVAELDEGLEISPPDRDFVVDHYTLTVLGHLLHWLATDMRQDPRILVYNLEFILHGSVRESLERFATRTDSKPG